MPVVDERIHSDYEKAHRRASLRSLSSLLLRHPNTLVPYADVQARKGIERETYQGMQAVPVRQIVGSADRYRDFDRAFFPKQRFTAGRWKNIDRAYHQDVRLPPIQLYKVGDVYFVKDGNHRVSVARGHGVEFIDAEVIEGHIRVPLTSSMSPQQILLQIEYSEFLRRTDLDKTWPGHDIRVTALGRYDELLEQIEARREQLSQRSARDVSMAEASENWYVSLYLPVVSAAKEYRVLREFPGKTEADFYVWAVRNKDRIEKESGGYASPQQLVRVYRKSEGGRDRVKRMVNRLRSAVMGYGPPAAQAPSSPVESPDGGTSES